MEMLTRLQSEQHVAKELAARLGQQEDELKEIREQVCRVLTYFVSLIHRFFLLCRLFLLQFLSVVCI